MRPIPPALALRLAEPVTSWAVCWRLVRRDGAALGFTTHDRDLWLDGLSYRSTPSFTPTALKAGGNATDAGDVRGVLTSAAIQAADLDAGRYDAARLCVFLVDWSAPELGTIPLFSGGFGSVRRSDDAFEVNCRSAFDALATPLVETYTPDCRADLGDARCRVSLARYTVVGQVSSVLDATRFAAAGLNADPDFYAYGRVRWLTGDNAALDQEVFSSTDAEVVLREAPPAPIRAGDRFQARAGCDKRLGTCRTKFANVLNFQGEPNVPGADSLLAYPGL